MGEIARPHRLHCQHLVLRCCIRNPLRLIGGDRHRLLDQNVLARLDGEQCVIKMEFLGCGDVDDIDVRVGDELFVTGVGRGDAVGTSECFCTFGNA